VMLVGVDIASSNPSAERPAGTRRGRAGRNARELSVSAESSRSSPSRSRAAARS
jgi:hypothetical protein